MFLIRWFGRRLSAMVGIAVLAASFVMTGPASGQVAGYWHTSGSRILDASNNPVRIRGINWYGFETANQTINGLYVQDYKSILQTLKAQGFNTVRIPLSSEMIEHPSSNLNIAYDNHAGPINTDLRGLTSMQVLDRLVAAADEIGLRIILDHHRSEAGNSAEANGLWYTDAYPETAWIADWIALADRYSGNPTVIGFDLHNEPHSAAGGGACWDCGAASDWHLAAERAGNAVLAVNPHLLIFVEGVDTYNGDSYWWGGNLEGVQTSPVVLNRPHRLVYSAHSYGPAETKQAWFNEGTSYASLSAVWTKHWGYISQQNIAPVWLGEFGTYDRPEDLRSEIPGSEGQWFGCIVQYLTAHPDLSWSYWAVNGEDRYGYLDVNYAAPANPTKAAMLSSLHAESTTGSTEAEATQDAAAQVVSGSKIGLGLTLVAGSGLTFAIFFGTNTGPSDKTAPDQGTGSSYEALDPVPKARKPPIERPVRQAVALLALVKEAPAAEAPAAEIPAKEAPAATTPPRLPMSPLAPAMGAPRPPKSLVAAASTTSIYLAWSAVPAEQIAYTVYGGTDPAIALELIADGVGASSYLVKNLQPDTAYYFQVKSVVDGISSAASVTATATTKAPAGLAAPTGLSVSNVAENEIDLIWSPSRSKEVLYSVYAGSAPGECRTLLASDLKTTSYQADRLLNGTTYYFSVKAVLGQFYSAESNEVAATTMAVVAERASPTRFRNLKQMGNRAGEGTET